MEKYHLNNVFVNAESGGDAIGKITSSISACNNTVAKTATIAGINYYFIYRYSLSMSRIHNYM